MGSRVAGSHFSEKSITGVSQLMEDLKRLAEDYESADIVFVIGKEEEHIYAHRIILMARCKSFQNSKRGDISRIPIPGCIVAPPSTPGSPVPIRLPYVQEEVFRKFILYVYTGTIILQDGAVFEMMSLAEDMGVSELRSICEDYITSTLSPLNACKFLAAGIQFQERTASNKTAKSFLDRCIAYVCENAKKCVQTNSFLTLPKDALIKIVSSDSFAMEEEEVWRAVLNWAKYQAGVTQPTAHWTEEERARVVQHLNGVINHVRLLLIDSQVFAEEVEPTGAVPIELSLERYRYAVLPNKFKERVEDINLQRRLPLNLFSGSDLLRRDKAGFQRILNSWYGNPNQCWQLLYKASRHKCSAEAFHRFCDGIAPLFVIALSNKGYICGGFTDVPWSYPQANRRTYTASDRAFLFNLKNKRDIPPKKFNVSKKPFAIGYHKECGPIFGGGADFLISNNCNVNEESYSNLPHSYDGENASSSSLMDDYHFSIVDYEVFTLSEE